jgi:hypothetical protein
MGGAFTAVADDGNAPYYNPAGLGQIQGTELVACYNRPYGLAVLQNSMVSLVQNTPFGVIGLSYHNFGKSNYYKEETIILSASRKVVKNLMLGTSLRVMTLEIMPLYGSDWTLGMDLGALWYSTPGIRLGAFLHNINLPHVGKEKEILPWKGQLGLALSPREYLLIAVDASKDRYYPLQIKVGQEVRLFQNLCLRGGVQTNPARFSVGGGVRAGFFAANYVYCSHPVLGGTHQVSVTLSNRRR